VNSLAGRTILDSRNSSFPGRGPFCSAWTLDSGSVVYIFVFAGAAALITVYLWNHDRKLLESRVKAVQGGEGEESKVDSGLCSLAFIATLYFLPRRHFLWSRVPWFHCLGDALVALGSLRLHRLQGEYLYSATIEVAAATGHLHRTIRDRSSSHVRRCAAHAFATHCSRIVVGLTMFIPWLWSLFYDFAMRRFFCKELPATENIAEGQFHLVPYIWYLASVDPGPGAPYLDCNWLRHRHA